MRKLPASSLGLAALMLLSGAAIGAIAVFFVADPANPPSLPETQPAAKAPVVAEPYADDQTVTVVFRRSPDSAVTAPVSGVITASACQPGAALGSGRSSFSLDGEPLITLHTAVPLFRDLHIGDRGPDVAALSAELRRLRMPATPGNTFTAADLRAARQLVIRAGGLAPSGHLSPANFSWIPDRIVTVSSCPVGLAQRVRAGATLALVDQAPEVAIDGFPASALRGQRKLRLDDVAFALPDSLKVTSRSDVAALARTATYVKAAEAAPPGKPVAVPASLTLVHPVSVVPLPPAAVNATSTDTGCVASGNRIYPVRLVGSDAGSTLVLFTGRSTRPATVSLSKPNRCS